MEERLLTMDLSDAYGYNRTKRTRRAVKLLQEKLARYLKAGTGSVRISEALNAALWEHGIERPPRRIKVKVEPQDGKVYVRLPGEKKPEPKKEKEAKRKKPVEKPAAKTGDKPGGKESQKEPEKKAVPEKEKPGQEKAGKEMPHQHGEYQKR